MRARFMLFCVFFAAIPIVLAARLGAFTEDMREIPLNTVYATFEQEPMRPADLAVPNEHFDPILAMVHDGMPRLALCEGPDIVAAVEATAVNFAMPDDLTPTVMAGMEDTIWLAAYLGSDGSLPSAYRILGVNVTGRTIRVSYEADDSPSRSCDLRAYLIWAPLSEMLPGDYTMELFDASNNRVTLSRTWNIVAR